MADVSNHELTADQRFKQLAAILARGAHRLLERRRRTENSDPKEVSESDQDVLEVPRDQSVSVSRRAGI